ncbi:MAG TPA: ATP-binding protein, partial [Planctomycetota bacterium]|nr:ATP-binding protein [Planctomycetota bacterium]
MNHSLRWRLCAVAAGFAGTLWLLGAGVAVALAWGTTAGCLAAAAAWLRRTRAMAARVDDAVRDLELALDLGVGSVNRPGAGDPLPILADAAARLRRAAQRGAARTEALARQVADMERRYEETLAMVRGRSGFMANLCHEIRTPLNGLLGFLSMLSETSLDEQQRDWVGIARSSGESLLALLNDVLDLAKIEAGKLSLEQIEFDRDELFENVAGLFAPAAHSRGVELLVDLDQSLPPRLLGDPVRLRQVLANLVGNAVKFTARGEVELAARCTARGGSRAVVEISVTDTGVGIPSDRLERLFLPFEQGDETTARRFGGTGLGLAIVKRIVEQMAGEITVESEVGKGTRVQ